MHKFEIEIKSLLGGREKAEELVAKMQKADPKLKVLGSHRQLNHYFEGGDLKKLYEKMAPLLSNDNQKKLEDLSKRAKNFSVRTRDADGKIILVVKAAVDDTTSENGTARLEFEAVPTLPPLPEGGLGGEGANPQTSIDELDKLVLDSGFKYQAKWSRERSEYLFHLPSPLAGEGGDEGEMNLSIDKNAGYGYLAEFEMVIDDASKASDTKQVIRQLMDDLGIEELPQDRLQRMFDFYNANWRDYYGTEKTFTIE